MSGNKVRAFGPGLEPKGNIVGEPASFTVETANAGKGKLDVVVWDPKGKQVKVRGLHVLSFFLSFFLFLLKNISRRNQKLIVVRQANLCLRAFRHDKF